MRTYRNLKWFILACTMAYALMGSATWRWYQIEIFPVYSWDLFSYVPNEMGDFSLRITAVNGQILPEAIFFEQAPHLFSEANSIVAFANFQTLGQAVLLQDDIQIKAAQKQIEAFYFQGQVELAYQLVWRQYEPRQRWLTGTVLEETIFGEFVYRKGE